MRAYDGGWAEYAEHRAERRRVRDEEAATAKPKREPRLKERAPVATKRRAEPLETLEREIEAQERLIASLERDLAEDWSNADKVAAHRRARADLQALFARWEALVDEVVT